MQLAIVFDPERCVKCEACTVACLDENDLAGGQEAWRKVYTIEEGKFPEVRVTSLSHVCQHCVDAPCATVCLTGAVFKQDNGIVRVVKNDCIGCQNCADACPFGVPRFDKDGKMEKCGLCACVHICPTKALRLCNVDEVTKQKQERAIQERLILVSRTRDHFVR